SILSEKRLVQALADKAASTASRIEAAERVGALDHASYSAWQTLCTVFQDAREDVDLRIAAAQALAWVNRAAAPNQLCRALQGDDPRRVAAGVVRILATLAPIPAVQQAALERDLNVMQTDIAPVPLANLASSYGREPRVLALLVRARQHPDRQIRTLALRGLGAVGELREVLAALGDTDAQVRAAVAETLGLFGLRSAQEIVALEQ